MIYMRQFIRIQSVNTDQLFNPEDKKAKNIGGAITIINNIKIKTIKSKSWSNACHVKWQFFREDSSVIKVDLI